MDATTVTSGAVVSVHDTARRRPRVQLDRLVGLLDGCPQTLDDPCAAARLLEQEVAQLLAKPAAIFVPTGKMAQQIALRVHADQRPGRRTVLAHPSNHLSLWEDETHSRLHDLHIRHTGDRYALMAASDIDTAARAGDVGAVLWELPQRELGGELPAWDDLTAQLAAARRCGAATHCDGARIWQTGPFYARPLAEICSGFDSVYVSLYKDLEAPCGAVLVGDNRFVASARAWRHRLGGTIDEAWPLALLARDGLHRVLEAMPHYVEHTRAVAAAITNTTDATVRPTIPHTAVFHIHLPVPADAARHAHEQLTNAGRIRLTLRFRTGPDPTRSSCEVTFGEAAQRLSPQQIADTVTTLIDLARRNRA